MPPTDGPAEGPLATTTPGRHAASWARQARRMATLARNSFDVCFAPDEAKKRWKAEVYDFAARNVPVAG